MAIKKLLPSLFDIGEATEGQVFRVSNGRMTKSGSGMVFKDNGRMGLGTALPDEKLEVYDGYVKITDAVPTMIFERQADALKSYLTANVGYFQFSYNSKDGDGYVKLDVNTSGGSVITHEGNGYLKLGANSVDNQLVLAANGNVGIGTSAPGYLLHLSDTIADIKVVSATGTNRAGLQTTNTGGTSYFYRESNNGGAAFAGTSPYATVIGGTGAYPLQLGTNNAVRMTIASDGKVSIGTNAFDGFYGDLQLGGTSTATSALTIMSSTTGTGGILFGDGTTGDDRVRGRIEYKHATNSFHIRTDAAERVTILSDGKVGIGTAAPEALLSFSAAEINNAKIRFLNQHSVTNDAGISTYDDTGGTDIVVGSNIYMNSAGALARWKTTEESSYIHIARSGYVGLGTGPTGSTATARLSINSTGAVTFSGTALFSDGLVGSPSISFAGDTDTGIWRPGSNQLWFVTTGVNRLKIDGSGNTEVTGALTVGGNISKTGDLTIDVSGDINLDSDNGYFYLQDGGTSVGLFKLTSSDFYIKSTVSDKDIIFQGNDGGSTITALTLDMSDSGSAIFNRQVTLYGRLTFSYNDYYFEAGTGSVFLKNASGGTVLGMKAAELVVPGDITMAATKKIYLDGGGNTYISEVSADQILFATGGNISFRATNTYLGSYAAGGGALKISGASATVPYIFDQGDTDTGIGGTRSDALSLITGGGARLTVENAQSTFSNNLIVTGNLTVNGTTTTIDTTNLLIDDPLMLLARTQSGTPTLDSGLIIERGSSTNVGLIWDESLDEFAFINTTDTATTAGNVTIASYANLHAGAGHFYNNLTCESTIFASEYIKHYGEDANYLRFTTSNLTISKQTTFSSHAIVQGELDVAEYLRHTGDVNTQIRFEASQISIGTSGGCQISLNNNENLYFSTGSSTTVALTLDTSQDATFAGSITVPLENNGAHPEIAFGDGDSGFYEAVDDSLRVAIAGSSAYEFSASGMGSSNQGRPWMPNETASATNPTLVPWRNDDDTGIGWAAANKLSLVAGGVGTATVTATGVGIGTTAPAQKLHVYQAGNTKPLLVESNDHVGIEVKGGTAHDNYVTFLDSSGTNAKIGWDHSASALKLNAAGSFSSSHLVVLGTGKVGIGTETPLQKLTIVGRANSDQADDYYGAWFDGNSASGGYNFFAVGAWYSTSCYFQRKTGQNYTHIYEFNSGHDIAIQAGSGSNGEVAGAGRVGIGTTTPYGKLEVAQATAFTTVYNASVDNIVLTRDATTGSGNYGGSIGFSPIDSPNERMAVIASVQTAADTNQMGLALFTHPSSTGGDAIVEAMRIKHDGKVGIGTTSPSSALDVRGAGQGLLNIQTTTSLNASYLSFVNTAGTAYVGITNSTGGTVITGGTAYALCIRPPSGKVVQFGKGDGSAPTVTIDDSGGVSAIGIFKSTGSPTLSAATASEAILTSEPGYGAFIYGQGTTYDVTLGRRNTAVALGVLADTVNLVTGGTLAVAGALTANSDLSVAEYIYHIGDTNTYQRFQADQWTLRTGGGDRIYVGSTGKVGIGTTSPNTALHVRGTYSSGAVPHIRSEDAADGTWIQMYGTANVGGYLETNSGEMLRFAPGGSTKMVLLGDGTGKVGIGTTAPDQKLHVNGTARVTGNLYLFDTGTANYLGYREWRINTAASGGALIRNDGDGGISLQDGSTTALFVGTDSTYGGKVGIGTTSPGGILSIGSSNDSYFSSTAPNTLNFFHDSNSDTGGWINYRGYQNGTTQPRDLIIGDGKGAKIAIFDGSTSRVGIGTDAPSKKLHVSGTTGDNSRMRFTDTTNSTNFDVGTDSDGGFFSAIENKHTRFYTNGSEKVRIQNDGKVGIGTTVPTRTLHVNGTGRFIDTGTESDPTLSVGYATGTDAINHRLGFYTDSETGYISNRNGNNGIRFRHRQNTIMQVGYGGDSSTPYVGIGTTTPSSRLHVAGTGDVARIGDNRWMGTNTVTIGTTFITGVTINLANHTGGYLKVVLNGDWSGHSAVGFMAEYFIQKGSTTAYSQPGTVIREVTNQHNSDFITSQILDPTLNSGNADFKIQFKTNTGSVSTTVMYEFIGIANSVT
jgi:hypothetical protein